MVKVYTDKQLVNAMRAAEIAHPADAPGLLSKPVAKIVEHFGALVYQRAESIKVTDDEDCALIDQFLG